MDDHKKKMIAPIVITVLVVLYYIFFFVIIAYSAPGWLKLICGIVPAVLAVVMIYVCIQRIREIEGGEEDDISKY